MIETTPATEAECAGPRSAAMRAELLHRIPIPGLSRHARRAGVSVIDRRLAAITNSDPGVHAHPTIGRRVFLRGIRAYVRRDFHPSQSDSDGLARAFLQSVGAEP